MRQRPRRVARMIFSAVLLGAGTLLWHSCLRRVESLESALTAAQVDKVQSVIRVFRKLIGRDPGTQEIAAMKNLPYPELVQTVLGSAQFDQEGFFNFHRERLLLNREGSQDWVKGSYNDYCAMRLEMSEASQEDRAGKGYWNTLEYKDRWVPLGDFGMNQCFFGTDIAHLNDAWIKYGGIATEPQPGQAAPAPVPVPPATTFPEKQAKACVQNLKFGFPDGDGSPEAQQKVKDFFAKLATLPEDQKKLSLMQVPEAEAMMMAQIRNFLLPDFGGGLGGSGFDPGFAAFNDPANPLASGDAVPAQAPGASNDAAPVTATAPVGPVMPSAADMKLELVKKDGKPVLLQELGSAGNQQCLFTPIDPVAWVKPKLGPNSGGGGFGGDFSDDSGDNAANFPPMGNGLQPPITFGPPVGLPDQPTLMPLAAAAQTPAMQVAASKAAGSLYIKIRMPAYFQGIHGSPYWLARHTSKQKNRDLHRARAVYFSYFCSEVNPDAANFSGGAVTEVPELLKPYFSPDDNHAKGSNNCFNCHSKVQPIANYFGLLTFGTKYDEGGAFPGAWPQYLNEEGAGFWRPGGIYDGQKFFEHQGTNLGLEGLANALKTYPAVTKCMAESTWATLVGRNAPLFDDERDGAIKAFQSGVPGGKASLSNLLQYLMVNTKRGPAYFTQGEKAFDQVQPDTGFQCPETPPSDFATSAISALESKCVDCHGDGFFATDGKFSVDSYFPNQGIGDTPAARGNLWQRLTCKVKMEKMPPGGGLDPQTRGKLWCYFSRTRDQLAKSGQIPANFAGKSCETAQPATAVPNALPHAIGTSTVPATAPAVTPTVIPSAAPTP